MPSLGKCGKSDGTETQHSLGNIDEMVMERAWPWQALMKCQSSFLFHPPCAVLVSDDTRGASQMSPSNHEEKSVNP